MVKALIFDLDDTLYYEMTYVRGALKEVSKYLSRKYEVNSEKLYKKSLEILKKDGRGKIFNELCKIYSISEEISILVEIYRESKPKLKLYEDSIKIIEYAKKNNIKTGIITDGNSKVQWNKIYSLGLDKLIDKIIVTDDYGPGYSKPHEKAYTEITRIFNLKFEECMYIGDNPSKDFVGAISLGMQTRRIVREKGDHTHDIANKGYDAHSKINSLNDIFYR